jgi:excisionase family DNA binding protein
MPDDVLTAAELAEYLRVSRTMIYRLFKARNIPAFKSISERPVIARSKRSEGEYRL